MERPLPEGLTSSVEAIESTHLVTEVHPLYDAEGNEIAQSEIKLEVIRVPEGESEITYLREWTLTSGEVSIDMFQFFSVTPNDTNVVIDNEDHSCVEFRAENLEDRRYKVSISKPTDLVQVAVIFHEFGHYDQNKTDPASKKMYELVKNLDVKWLAYEASFHVLLWVQMKEALAQVRATPEIKKWNVPPTSPDQISELDDLYNRYNILQVELDKFFRLSDKDVEDNPALQERAEAVGEEMETIRKAFEDLVNQYGFRHTFAAPSVYLERDATKRAFVWMRSIKQKYGINLQSGKIGQLHLKNCLKTYTPKQKFREISES